MATAYDGTNYAKAADPSSANILDPGTLAGKVRVMQDTYTGAVVATADYIRIGKALPTGAQVVDIIVGNTATGSGNFLTVGDEGSATRYLTSYSTSGANVKIGPSANAGMNYVVTGTTDNVIRVYSGGTEGAAPLSGGTIKVTVFYTVE